MNSKKDWTDRLPELLEGYTEAEPEGLWDAVRAGVEPKKRRVAGLWWYAGGAIAAAAAAVVAVLLWPAAPSEGISVVPGNLVAETAPVPDTEEEVVVLEEMEEVPPQGAEKPVPVKDNSAPVTEDPEKDRPTGDRGMVEESETPEYQESVTNKETPEEQITVGKPERTEEPAAEKKESAEAPVTVPTEVPDRKEAEQEKTDLEEEAMDFPAEEEKPATRIKLRKYRNPSTRVQISLSSTGYLAQAATTTTTGVGLPSYAMTKADGATIPGLSMLSRNKTSTTDATHTQSARVSLGLRINLTNRWGIETGIVSSTLDSKSTTAVGNSSNFTNGSYRYLGIPLYATYNLLEWKRLGLYLTAGPMYEFTVGTSKESRSYFGETLSESNFDDALIKDDKWSLNAGAGAQLRVFRRGALFIQPGFSYHFADGSSLETFYTEHPASFNLTFGYRLLF